MDGPKRRRPRIQQRRQHHGARGLVVGQQRRAGGRAAADPVGGNGPGIVYNTVTQTTVAANLPGVGYYINDAGQAGGTENGFTEGFVWSQTASNGWAQGVTPLPQLGSVLGISQDGQYAVGQDPGITNGVVYDNVAKSATTITGGTAISVNNNGWVGGSSSTANYAYIDPYPSAWLWDGTTLHTTDLSAMLPTGYTAVSVMAVNDSDDILMWGVDGDQWDNVHAFLLTPTATPPTQHPGDANGDGRVDVNDLTIVLTNFGQSGMRLESGQHGQRPDGHGRRQRPHDRAEQLRLDRIGQRCGCAGTRRPGAGGRGIGRPFGLRLAVAEIAIEAVGAARRVVARNHAPSIAVGPVACVFASNHRTCSRLAPGESPLRSGDRAGRIVGMPDLRHSRV